MMDSSGNGPIGDARPDLYTVTEISEAVRQHLESEFPRVNVIGEIANFKLHTSGHAYFTLRDGANMIHGVLFRRYAERVACAPGNGMLVIAPGRISHFGGSGQTQIIATDLIPAGHGNMELEFRRLLKRLMDEGLTAADRKRAIARYPARIAVITSQTGAVIRDIVDTLRRRWPVAEIVHVRAEVQGPGSAQSIVQAFETTNGMEDVDTVILARGGGSIEDLWSFNSEEVARAVAGSVHPVIAGIGHEIDTTVADHVADLRAATPTAAAELATPVMDEVRRALDDFLRRISMVEAALLESRGHLAEYLVRSSAFPAIEHRMERAELEIDGFLERISNGRRSEILAFARLLDEFDADMARCIDGRTGRLRASLDSTLERLARGDPAGGMRLVAGSIDHGLRVMMVRLQGDLSLRKKEIAGRLDALAGLDPRGVLRRGYSFCTAGRGERVIPRSEEISRGDRITVHFYDGGVLCSVREKQKGRPWRKK
ncbi:MAG: exodeoxyribonuclease VII large subunit [Candidatus Krumholzibacteria bacterium]|nr:exodeoxyribonuclease VII large subunit [Candidatus Krumholzibacteria bacterium]